MYCLNELEKLDIEELRKFINEYNEEFFKEKIKGLTDILNDIENLSYELYQSEDIERSFLLLSLIKKVESWNGNRKNERNKMIEHFTDGMYAEAIHFLMELIQNADDAALRSSQKESNQDKNYRLKLHLEKNVESNKLILEYDEDGFSYEDIDSITSIGNSSKIDTKLEKGKATIGEKGIGFKSVFALAEKVTINSGWYEFYIQDCRKSDNEYERKGKTITVPILEKVNDKYRNGTKLTIDFKESVAVNAVESKINDYFNSPHEVFLFLQKISEIKFDNKEIKLEIDDTHKIDCCKGKKLEVVKVITSENQEQEFIRYTRDMTFSVEAAKSRWSNLKIDEETKNLVLTREASICFPKNINEKKGRLFSFLPTNVHITGIPIYLNIDAHLKGSRGDIKESDFIDETAGALWNKELKEQLPEFLKDAYLSLKKFENYKTKISGYFPEENSYSGNGNGYFSLKKEFGEFIELLKEEEIILLYDNNTFKKPSQIIYANEQESALFYKIIEKDDSYRKKLELATSKFLISKLSNNDFEKSVLNIERENKISLMRLLKESDGINFKIEDNKEILDSIYEYLNKEKSSCYFENKENRGSVENLILKKIKLFPTKKNDTEDTIMVKYFEDKKELFIPNSESSEYPGIYENFYIIDEKYLMEIRALKPLIESIGIKTFGIKEFTQNLLKEKKCDLNVILENLKRLESFYNNNSTRDDVIAGIKFVKDKYMFLKGYTFPFKVFLSHQETFDKFKINEDYVKLLCDCSSISKMDNEVTKSVFEMMIYLGVKYEPEIEVDKSVDKYTKEILKNINNEDRHDYSSLYTYIFEKFKTENIVDSVFFDNFYIQDIRGKFFKLKDIRYLEEKKDCKDTLEELLRQYYTDEKVGIVIKKSDEVLIEKNCLDLFELVDNKFTNLDSFLNGVPKLKEKFDEYAEILMLLCKNYTLFTWAEYTLNLNKYSQIFEKYYGENKEGLPCFKKINILEFDEQKYEVLDIELNYDELSYVFKDFCNDFCQIYVFEDNLFENINKCLYYDTTEDRYYFISKELSKIENRIKLIEQILSYKNIKFKDIDKKIIKDSLRLNDEISQINNIILSEGNESDVYLSRHKKIMKEFLSSNISIPKIKTKDFADHFRGLKGYGYICPFCGMKSDIGIDAFTIRRKIHVDENVQEFYLFYVCKNCLDILKHAKIIIRDLKDLLFDFENYYESDTLLDHGLDMKTIKITIQIEGGETFSKHIKISYYNMLILYKENQKLLDSNSKNLMIDYNNIKYEFLYGYNNQKKEVFIKNATTGIAVASNSIYLDEYLLEVVGSDLRIKASDCDREFGCFDAIYCDGESMEWDECKKIEDYEDEVYNLLHRIIRFTHRDLDDSELFHYSENWINNPNT